HAMMLEIFGKDDGLCRGKGGSMHIADLDKGMLGANGIVGGGPPLAIGAALSAKTLKNGGIGLSFTGDGGSNQGLTFEAINMAVVLKLPVIFVFENNGFGEGTAHDYAVGSKDIAGRAAGFGLPAEKVDGTDFFAVYEVAQKAIERARRGEGPSVIETVTNRFYGHFEGDPGIIRSKEELDYVKEHKDPLKIFREKVKGKIDEAKLDAIDAQSKANVDDAVAKARAAKYPEASQLLTDVYVSYKRNSRTMPNKSYRNAIKEAIELEMRRDPSVIVVGEDVRGGHGGKNTDENKLEGFGGVLGVTKGLWTEFGSERVIDTPITESAIIGMAAG